MHDRSPDHWQWSNLPVPEAHIAGLLVGAALQLRRPWRLCDAPRRAQAVGLALLVTGVSVVVRSVRAVGDVEVARPGRLVTEGPYGVSRNPMYLGWNAIFLGLAAVANAAWLLVIFPAVAVATHLLVRREERHLERDFGDAYARYRRAVPRYLLVGAGSD